MLLKQHYVTFEILLLGLGQLGNSIVFYYCHKICHGYTRMSGASELTLDQY